MHKKVYLFIAFTMIVSSITAQKIAKPAMLNKEDSLKYGWWTRGTQLGVNVSGSLFSKNWQGGGINNYILGALFNNKSVFTKGKGQFVSDFQGQLAFTNNFPDGVRVSRKSLDRLFFDNKYSRKINDKLNWFAGLNFQTQFAKGYFYNDATDVQGTFISNFMSPGYLAEGVGLDYKATPHLLLSFGGATLRQTFVLDQNVYNEVTLKSGEHSAAGVKDYAYGVQKGKRVLSEMGLQFVAAYDKNITKNINLKGRWQTFVAIAPKSVHPWDHRFNLIATAKINKYLSLNASLLGILDQDQVSKADTKSSTATAQDVANGVLVNNIPVTVGQQIAAKYSSILQLSGGANVGLSIQL